ncbi:MAG TPA: uroporphyrinogen decarboxylase family protein [bacterium]|nr:uroporphyrinogen decarboxylase family protein [bacterium]HQL62167.1 uroporphyrinogen decarboxylase family protein [bacterium]
MGKAHEKIRRMRHALSHKEGDRVPAGEFFWTQFLNRCKEKWGEGFDPYREFDLDYVVINPNMDPKIQPFKIIEQTGEDIVIQTGFGATIRRRGIVPMPMFEDFSIKEPGDMARFEFDDPADSRRFFQGGDDQINCVGDTLVRDIPSWKDRLEPFLEDFAVFGSICEPFEFLWRIIGTENALIWMASETELLIDFVDRIGEFLFSLAKAEIEAGKGRLSGMYIWGDVAYRNGMLFGPTYWRKIFKPHVKNLIELFHENDLMVVYHGCGNARAVFDDFVEMGLDAYNPLEAKADLDAVELKKEYAGKLAFAGNIDVRVLESGDFNRIEQEIQYKLQAARGGGWVFQSDHSVSSEVDPDSYRFAVDTLRKYGYFPLNL